MDTVMRPMPNPRLIDVLDDRLSIRAARRYRLRLWKRVAVFSVLTIIALLNFSLAFAVFV